MNALAKDLLSLHKPLSTLEETLALHIRAEKLAVPVRQFQFHPERKWRLDFAWPLAHFAVEVQGGVHTIREQFYRDIQKRAHALMAGWTVLEVGQREIHSGQAIAWVKALLWERAQLS